MNETVARDVLWVFRQLFRGPLPDPPDRAAAPLPPAPPEDYWFNTRNLTAAFNCRPATGNPGSLSHHSYGWAIDINPLQNPYVTSDGSVLRRAAKPYVDRSRRVPGMIHPGDVVVRSFARDRVGVGRRLDDAQGLHALLAHGPLTTAHPQGGKPRAGPLHVRRTPSEANATSPAGSEIVAGSSDRFAATVVSDPRRHASTRSSAWSSSCSPAKEVRPASAQLDHAAAPRQEGARVAALVGPPTSGRHRRQPGLDVRLCEPCARRGVQGTGVRRRRDRARQRDLHRGVVRRGSRTRVGRSHPPRRALAFRATSTERKRAANPGLVATGPPRGESPDVVIRGRPQGPGFAEGAPVASIISPSAPPRTARWRTRS